MGHTLALSIPNGAFEPLMKRAGEEGQGLEELASEWLQTAIQRETDDDLLRLAGSLQADVADLGERHDRYLGQAFRADSRERADV